MAKDKQNNGQAKVSNRRGESHALRCLLRKAKRVAKSSGKPTLLAYVASHAALKVAFPKDIERLVSSAWSPKPKTKPEATVA